MRFSIGSWLRREFISLLLNLHNFQPGSSSAALIVGAHDFHMLDGFGDATASIYPICWAEFICIVHVKDADADVMPWLAAIVVSWVGMKHSK